jgi:integrase/recombinase XerD
MFNVVMIVLPRWVGEGQSIALQARRLQGPDWAPAPWSTTNMTDNPKTCVDPYLDSFVQSFAAANYTVGTIRTYRHLARKLGRMMDAAGIAPSALTPDLADQLARTAERGSHAKIRFHHFARRFAEHLIAIGVAQPVPMTEALVARTALLADFETYLVKQRGLSQRTIYHVLRFADRFLDHRFGTGMIDLMRLRASLAMSRVISLASRGGNGRPSPVTSLSICRVLYLLFTLMPRIP